MLDAHLHRKKNKTFSRPFPTSSSSKALGHHRRLEEGTQCNYHPLQEK